MDSTGKWIDEKIGPTTERDDANSFYTSESHSKTEDFSLEHESNAQPTRSKIDDISPYQLLFPYHATEDDDDDDDLSYSNDTEFLDVGWDGKCLQDLEDIDFEFVYALHTFVATVEGQANATKGDTMVLLDDSNSYWWLVRVVKDSSIGTRRIDIAKLLAARSRCILGYLPAEHIETPTERLARLNKHRNIDVCSSIRTKPIKLHL